MSDETERNMKLIIESASGRHVMAVNSADEDGMVLLYVEAEDGVTLGVGLWPEQVRELMLVVGEHYEGAIEQQVRRPEDGNSHGRAT